MAIKVVMEALSPTMEEGRLVKWHKQEGDEVAKGDVLAEVETDKAIMELVARGSGVLRKQLLPEGGTTAVGTPVAVIAARDENIDALLSDVQGAAAPPSQVVAETREEAGANAIPETPPQSQGEASTPPQQKTPSRAAAPPSGAPPRSPEPSRGAPQAPSPAERGGGNGGGRLRSSPLARRLASEQGLDLARVSGSGPGGRIVKRDIQAALESGVAAAPARRAPAAPAAGGPEFEDIPLTQIRKTIARRLAESIGPIPTFYLTAEFDVERMAEMRAAMVELGDEYRVSVNDILLKAVATALARHPEVNAHWLGDRIRQHHRVHVGMAVAIPQGLITPVIFDADRKGLLEISAEARALAARARERKLTPEEYTGATFSVSNLGMLQIEQFTAIINPPEVGILAVGAMEPTPIVAADGSVAVRRRLRVTMSCDHRAVDGATGARFLQTLRRMIENPLLLVS
ncbi:MAG TPA: pyruvate dehydrogenase complex dihydrolipoamide acetyltransferase [Gemmatimonadaceae bacterium]|nr:pyruvate dehydrogenase complex dihydrolipoamide acetyltransferase [Gemmatimonadaceae bacterium]